MEHVSPYLRLAETAIKDVLKHIKRPAIESVSKTAFAAIDPLLSKCTCPSKHVYEISFYVLFAATIVFLTLAQRYQQRANKALIGLSWASAVSALHFFWLHDGSPLVDFALILSVASVPFVVYALSSLANSGFFSFVFVLVLLVAKDYFLAIASVQQSFDAKLLPFAYSIGASGLAGLVIWFWGLRGGFRGFLVTLVYTAVQLLRRGAWIIGSHGLLAKSLLSSQKEALLLSALEIGANVLLLVLVALFSPAASSSSPSAASITRAPAAVSNKKKKQ